MKVHKLEAGGPAEHQKKYRSKFKSVSVRLSKEKHNLLKEVMTAETLTEECRDMVDFWIQIKRRTL